MTPHPEAEPRPAGTPAPLTPVTSTQHLEAYSQNIGDMLRAIKSCAGAGMRMPALALSYSLIDNLAWAAAENREQGTVGPNFKAWANKWLMPRLSPKAPDVTAADLYEARCAVLHRLTGTSDRFAKGEARRILYAWGDSSVEVIRELIAENQLSASHVALHYEDFYLVLLNAIDGFFAHVDSDSALRERLERAAREHYFFLSDDGAARPAYSTRLGDLENQLSRAQDRLNKALADYESNSETQVALEIREMSLIASMFLYEVGAERVSFARNHPSGFAETVALKGLIHRLYEYDKLLKDSTIPRILALAKARGIPVDGKALKAQRMQWKQELSKIQGWSKVRNEATGHYGKNIARQVELLKSVSRDEVMAVAEAFYRYNMAIISVMKDAGTDECPDVAGEPSCAPAVKATEP